MGQQVLEVRHISKEFVRINSGRKRLTRFFSGVPQEKTLLALNDISFTLEKGQVLGVVGPNGSGKSTLLSVISGVTKPTEGEVAVSDRTVSVLELGVGFVKEFSGKDNIYHTAALFGTERRIIDALYNQIVSFSGLDDFMDMPVKHYSSGMFARLAFSVVAHMEAGLYLFDEVLAVGDAMFRRKALEKIRHMKQAGKSIIVVSHNLNEIAEVCDSVILLDKGRMTASGRPIEVMDILVKQYFSEDFNTIENSHLSMSQWRAGVNDNTNNIFDLKLLSFHQEDTQGSTLMKAESPVILGFEGILKDGTYNIELVFTITLLSGFPIFNATHLICGENTSENKLINGSVSFPKGFFNPMIYYVDFYVLGVKDATKEILYSLPKCLCINFAGENEKAQITNIGPVNINLEWTHRLMET